MSTVINEYNFHFCEQSVTFYKREKPFKGHGKENGYTQNIDSTSNDASHASYCSVVYTLWLSERSNFPSSFDMSLIGSWICDFGFILFNSFSTRKKIHWKRRKISKAAIVNTVRWLWRRWEESLYVHVQRRTRLLPITQM